MGTRRWLLALAVLVLLSGRVSAQQPSPSPSPTRSSSSTAAERQARGEAAAKAFVHGQYEEALAIYVDLYAQSGGRPEYLRNIGRCQQKLNRYAPAIESFKDYLRRAKNITAEEKREVRQFISELETARANEAGHTAAPAAVAAPAPATSPSSVPAQAAPAPGVTAVSPPATAPSSEQRPDAPTTPAAPAAGATWGEAPPTARWPGRQQTPRRLRRAAG
jgi:hypothetical protein